MYTFFRYFPVHNHCELSRTRAHTPWSKMCSSEDSFSHKGLKLAWGEEYLFSAYMLQCCTISIDLVITWHTHFYLTSEIKISQFFRFSVIFQQCEKVMC